MTCTSSLRTLSFLYPKSHPHPCGKLILLFGTQAVWYRGFSSLMGKMLHMFLWEVTCPFSSLSGITLSPKMYIFVEKMWLKVNKIFIASHFLLNCVYTVQLKMLNQIFPVILLITVNHFWGLKQIGLFNRLKSLPFQRI